MRLPYHVFTEIQTLQALRGRVPRTTLWGDDNVAAIDAQLLVLRLLEDEQDVYDHGYKEHVHDYALMAASWLQDDEVTLQPSFDWLELVGEPKTFS